MKDWIGVIGDALIYTIPVANTRVQMLFFNLIKKIFNLNLIVKKRLYFV